MIQLNNFTKRYGQNTIFDSYYLSIAEGVMVAITGKSGSGKSTLLNCICGLEKFDTGEVWINSMNIAKLSRRQKMLMYRNEFGYLFQNYALVSYETIEYNLNLVLTYMKLSQKEKRERMRNVLEKVGLEHPLKTKVFTLSGGEQQRVALARLLLKKPKIIFADEPTGALDDKNKHEVMQLITSLKGQSTICIVTHDPEVIQYCDYEVKL
ncbi:putative bacteriocin export ABC transporter [Staphylococcus massiliensis]|uniref:putative bacteriocin export ABC transporter n=1 Tax=Staphylococcus massiliensis TaxID=555791 RepID=UPI001EDF3885|nr:putative bacteriocin export ABC transporter [Staphylococcus massiliensis]MCG3399054.1 putative bacteriocin export ABC transporter [Staphylococcus massiliensis]